MNVEILGENVITYGINVVYRPCDDNGSAMSIDNSTVMVDLSGSIAQIQYGMHVELDYNEYDEVADAYGLYVKNSQVYVYYGAGLMASGITVNYNTYDAYASLNEAVYVRKSTIHSESKVAGDWDEETLGKYASWENVAISVNANFDEAGKSRLITLDKANVTAIAGEGTFSIGFEIKIEEESYESYIDEVLYATDCKLTLIGGKGTIESSGLRLNAEEKIYGDFGIQLIDCETLAIGGDVSYIAIDGDFWYGTTAGMYLEMDTEDELLYLEGGRTVLIAPDGYEAEEGEEIVTYNKYSYALIVDGDDGEIVSGTLEMWAGTYCVDGDLDIKNALKPASSMTYDDEMLDYGFGSDIRFEEGAEEDAPKYAFIFEYNVYIGGLAISDGEYYVNGKHGEVGEVYNEEPENWNAKLEAVYDEHGEFVKYVLTLNDLYLASQEDSLLFAQILSFGDLDIVLVEGSENVVEANQLSKEYATYRTASAIDARTWWLVEVVDEEYGETYTIPVVGKGGIVTVSGNGALTLVGSENGLTHDGILYVAMESYFENGAYTLQDLEKEVEATQATWTVKAHAHTASEWIVAKEATCTEAGSKYKVCTDCKAILEREEITQTGHTEEVDKGVDATCTQTGLTEGKHCSVCKEVLLAQTEVAKLAHTASEWTVDVPAGCENAGSQHKYCTVCEEILEIAEIAKTGHAYGEWTVVVEATNEEAGLREKTCANCGDKIAEIIPEIEELSDGAIVGITLGSTVAGCSGITVGLWFIFKKKLLGL